MHPAVGSIQGKVWGTTQLIYFGNNVEVHRIFARKGCYCSLHRHRQKSNLFYVETGRLLVRTNKDGLDDESILLPGQSTVIRPGDLHQFEALEDSWVLEIYSVTLSADDIERTSSGGRRSADKDTGAAL